MSKRKVPAVWMIEYCGQLISDLVFLTETGAYAEKARRDDMYGDSELRKVVPLYR